jgi:hypothetical protein
MSPLLAVALGAAQQLVAAAILLPAAAAPERLVYHCRNEADDARFVLAFERRGERLRDVTVAFYGWPRLGDDMGTRWRGRMVGAEARFRLEDRSGVIGDMRLSPEPGNAGASRLTWTSTSSGGHLQLVDPTRTATCSSVAFEQADPAT